MLKEGKPWLRMITKVNNYCPMASVVYRGCQLHYNDDDGHDDQDDDQKNDDDDDDVGSDLSLRVGGGNQ